MLTFTYNPDKKNFVEVKNEDASNPSTMIKIEDTTNEGILKTCQDWLDAFGLTDVEYRVNVQLH